MPEEKYILLYTLGGYMKDGSQEEYTIYKDDQRYVVNDIGGTLIIEDIRARVQTIP